MAVLDVDAFAEGADIGAYLAAVEVVDGICWLLVADGHAVDACRCLELREEPWLFGHGQTAILGNVELIADGAAWASDGLVSVFDDGFSGQIEQIVACGNVCQEDHVLIGPDASVGGIDGR